MFTEAKSALTYIEGGRAVITVKSKRSGAHLTFRFGKDKRDEHRFYVSLRNSAVEREDRYIGIWNAARGTFATSPKSAFKAYEVEPRTVGYVMGKIRAGELPADAEVSHAGVCGRCARMLTHPESLAAGFGPECIGKV